MRAIRRATSTSRKPSAYDDFSNVPVVDDLTVSETIDSLFVGAIRDAAKWPKPHRDLAREALRELPADRFEPSIAALVN